MLTNRRLFSIPVLALALTCAAFGQVATVSTTFSTAVAYNATTVNLTSATGVTGLNQGAFTTMLYVDRELMGVISISGTAAVVQRGADGTKQSAHNTAAFVWVGPPNYFSLNSDPIGTCVRANEVALPRFYEMSGNGFDCPAAGPRANQWTVTYAAPGTFSTTDNSQTGVPSGLKVCHATYSFAVDGGAVSTITPSKNCTVPINAVIYQAFTVVGATTVGTTGNVSVGLSAGAGGAAALLAATARASLTTGLMFQAPPVPAAASASNTSFVKMSAAGAITVTIATNALTAGILDVYVFYVDVNI